MTRSIDWPHHIHILIPAYNAQESLSRILPQILEIVPADHITIVDDGSAVSAKAICQSHGITCIENRPNRGKGFALRTGFATLLKQKGTDWIITLDADGQHAIDDLHLFVEAATHNPPAGIIIGRRQFMPGTMPPHRIFSNFMTSKALSLICKAPVLDSQCGYRAYSTEMLARITLEFDRFEMESEVIIKACAAQFPVRFVPIRTLYLDGKSNINNVLDTFRWLRGVWKAWRNIKRPLPR